MWQKVLAKLVLMLPLQMTVYPVL